MLPLRRLTRESWPEPDVNSLRTRLPVYNGVLPLLLFMLFPSPSMRSLLMLSTGHQKAQAGNAAKACRNYVKQRQYLSPYYHLDHVSPRPTSVVGVCMCCPSLRSSFASHVGRRAVGVVAVLLLLLSGDVETNPGPVGEVLCLTV